jgi:hypothetical protein
MQKQFDPKKTDKNPDLSLNKGKNIRFRKRIQEDKEKQEEVKEYLKEEDAGKSF